LQIKPKILRIGCVENNAMKAENAMNGGNSWRSFLALEALRFIGMWFAGLGVEGKIPKALGSGRAGLSRRRIRRSLGGGGSANPTYFGSGRTDGWFNNRKASRVCATWTPRLPRSRNSGRSPWTDAAPAFPESADATGAGEAVGWGDVCGCVCAACCVGCCGCAV